MMLSRWIAAVLAIGTLLVAGPGWTHEDHKKANPAVEAAAQPGAPAAMDHSAMDHAAMDATAEPKPMPQRLVRWLGRWHPAVVHFPIALFLVTAALEAAALLGRRAWLTDGTRVLVGLAALSALVAAALGWLAMGLPGPVEDLTHTLHRWIGTGIALAGLMAWWAKERSVRPSAGRAARGLYGGVLAAITVAVLLNAYLGGALTHGVNHLRF